MASIRREIAINVPAAVLWDALADVGALHTRLVAGFVTDCRLDPELGGGASRVVTFANGVVARERIVAVDAAARRIVWSATGGPLKHHNAAVEVLAESGAEGGGRSCRAVWVADLLPDAMAPAIAGMIDAGLVAMKRTLER